MTRCTGFILAGSGGLDSYLQETSKICPGPTNNLSMNGCMDVDANGKPKLGYVSQNGGCANGMHE